MKLGLLSDVHANQPAFDAVLADAESEGIERWVCCGDTVGYGSWPVECLDRLRHLPGMDQGSVMGNHDAMLLGLSPFSRPGDLAWNEPTARWFLRDLRQRGYVAGHSATAIGKVLKDHAERLRARRDLLDWLRTRPVGRLEVHPGVSVCHGGSWKVSWGPLSAYVRSSNEAMLEYQAAPFEGILVLGHSHEQAFWSRAMGGRWQARPPLGGGRDQASLSLPDTPCIVNPGSVGQARNGDPRAAWAWIDLGSRRIHYRLVAYDVEATARQMKKRGSPRRLVERLRLGE